MEYRKLFDKPYRTFRNENGCEFKSAGDGYEIYQLMMDFEPQCSNGVRVERWFEIINGKEILVVKDKYIHIGKWQ